MTWLLIIKIIMKKLLFFLVISCSLQTQAQTYSISFAGAGLSSVEVENLKSGLVVNLSAGDVLRLTITTDIPDFLNQQSSGIKVYPNPMKDKSTLQIIPPVSGDAIISVCDMTGKVLTQFKGYVENSIEEFSLSGIKNGLHIINVQGRGYHFSEKFLSNGKSNGTASIVRLSNNVGAVPGKIQIKGSKGVQETVEMVYHNGERLKFKGVSGNNSTVMTDIPTSDKTIEFTFIECKDGDNNYYPVVTINNQTWMAENLKTTKYNDGTALLNLSDNTAWMGATTGAYCYYANDPANSTIYGKLYNWFVVDNNEATKVESNGGKNVCPTGWHVSGDEEWTTLTTFLGGQNVIGGKIKETGTTHWESPNTDATNETGFTAVPGGSRNWDGSYNYIGQNGIVWSTLEYSATSARMRLMYNYRPSVDRLYSDKRNGNSVRCVRDF
jgi:uncharacterized protein (TIGR02145 family)